METRKIALTLSGEAIDILEGQATERKRGEFVSNLLVEWAANQTPASEPGILENIQATVRRIEKKLGY
jgi:hypothetical protein